MSIRFEVPQGTHVGVRLRSGKVVDHITKQVNCFKVVMGEITLPCGRCLVFMQNGQALIVQDSLVRVVSVVETR